MPKPTQASLTAAPKPPDEKITVNLGCVDLGQIDLLVHEGFYSNRTDFIRSAVRAQAALHASAVHEAVKRQTLVLGLLRYTKPQLEDMQRAGEKLRVRVLGLVIIDPDVSSELARATIESVTVLGALRASASVRAALASRMS